LIINIFIFLVIPSQAHPFVLVCHTANILNARPIDDNDVKSEGTEINRCFDYTDAILLDLINLRRGHDPHTVLVNPGM
jgi:hypothetical protein